MKGNTGKRVKGKTSNVTIVEISDNTCDSIKDTLPKDKGHCGISDNRVTNMEPNFPTVEPLDLQKMLQAFKKDIVRDIVEQVVSHFQMGNYASEKKDSEAQSNNPLDALPLKIRRTTPFPDEVIQLNGYKKSKQSVASKCSTSPDGPPKPAKRRIKEKLKPLRATTPSFPVRRGLFNTKKDVKYCKVPEESKDHVWGGPFLVEHNTSNEIVDLLNFIFMKRPLTYHQSKFDNEIIASWDGFSATRSDLEECLNPGQCLDDTVINMFASYLNEHNSVKWFFLTFFAAIVTVPHTMMSNELWIKNTFSLSKLDRFSWRMKEASQIFIPMHDKITANLGHWFLLLVRPRSGYAIIVDSSPDTTREAIRVEHARRVLKLLDIVFENEIALDMREGFQFATLPWATKDYTFPIQMNDFDCGLYVIRNMQHYPKKWDVEYVSEDHRASLVVECVCHHRNELQEIKQMVEECLGSISVPVVDLVSSDYT